MSIAVSNPVSLRRVLLFIDGKFVEASGGSTFDNHDPATEQVTSRIAEASVDDVDAAVQAARRAFDSGVWSRLPAGARRKVLYRLADLLENNRDELARLETTDNGKPIRDSLSGDLPRAVAYLRIFADYLATMGSECYPMDDAGFNYVTREPLGVVGLITPWNFPLMILCSKLAPALAMGNSVVAKPAEWTPLTAARLTELTLEAGLPPGVFNLVHGFGPNAAGEAITRHPDVQAISFTGESATGQAIMAASAATLKRLSFELGGKGATIVFADADLDQALEIAATAAFKNAGQVCTAGSRVLVEAPLFEKFVAGLETRARALRVGDPLDPLTDIGPLVHREHRQRVQSFLDDALAKGSRVVCGGGSPRNAPSPNFIEPTVIAELDPYARVCQDEIFGPVVSVTPFETEADAIRIANSTRYGLSAAVCTSHLARAHRVAARLRAGTIWINSWSVRDPRVPFGGFKMSGLGREGGMHSLNFFAEIKNTFVRTD